jgi:hypothetical protein
MTIARKITIMSSIVAIMAALIFHFSSADASIGRVGQRETVCADDLYFRTSPDDHVAFDGVLHRNETFLVQGPRSGGYVHGFAYGHINRSGWVIDGYFCG